MPSSVYGLPCFLTYSHSITLASGLSVQYLAFLRIPILSCFLVQMFQPSKSLFHSGQTEILLKNDGVQD